ncbi:MAG: carbon-nitrogen family hydrolase [Alkalibacterium sp.]|uniref:Carbon-nitrogen hydrolase n=1 Tax=Alkalibacterium gilvum TaxID=1130080 RepID=A0A1H6UUP5_9LACT|nr:MULTISPECIES: carbon-nitrogen family hydrolase [Alkalibacterium]MDN6194101.1 carbon-nitrogen family hydrolase [Alkalibacterium sp.]MDN6294137.1 carbon-nitrogen family hydrolase [Alkalibacterium sp.]MDN6295700.1 carbon-nitrogen family hydrolase [Alkalibacterium sp.]MDN6326703.1 carbon-nitrogen family hydrolase [Alkalibacterium sp.]MDN6385993.1 carbon-nitrogen family hydrolase [Alkalibacterium sp.]
MKIAIAQLDLVFEQPMKNKNKVISYVRMAIMKNKPDVIVLPEMWKTSYYPSNIDECADADGHETKQFLSELAKEHDVNIIGGSVGNRMKEKFYNTSYSFDRTGKLIHTYNKVHLYRTSKEQEFFSPGSEMGIFEIDGTKVGLVTGYDLEFPEWIRKMALEDIKILFVPAAWTYPHLLAWETLLSARAIENQIFVVGVNSVGTTKKLNFCGHSSIINPSGKTIASGRMEEMLIWGNLDLNEISKSRQSGSIYIDRRPELYKQ